MSLFEFRYNIVKSQGLSESDLDEFRVSGRTNSANVVISTSMSTLQEIVEDTVDYAEQTFSSTQPIGATIDVETIDGRALGSFSYYVVPELANDD